MVLKNENTQVQTSCRGYESFIHIDGLILSLSTHTCFTYCISGSFGASQSDAGDSLSIELKT